MLYQLYSNTDMSKVKWTDSGANLVGRKEANTIVTEAHSDEEGSIRFTLQTNEARHTLFIYENKDSIVISEPKGTAKNKTSALTLETLQAFSRILGISEQWSKKTLSENALKGAFKEGIVKRLVTNKGEHIGQQLKLDDVQGKIQSISSYRPLPRAMFTLVPSGQIDIAEVRATAPHDIFKRLVSSR